MQWIHNISSWVFSGGGVKGVAYCGALMALEHIFQRGECDLFGQLRHTSGASVGALFAAALALRMTGERLFRILDTECMLSGIIDSLDLQQLQTSWGLDSGEKLRESIKRVVQIGLQDLGAAETDAEHLTLKQLQALTGVAVKISVTRLGNFWGHQRPRTELFGPDSHPDVLVVDAIYISMAMPILFCPIRFRDGIYTDGAVMNNLPVENCSGPETIVLTLRTRCLSAYSGFGGYIETLLNTASEPYDEARVFNFPYVLYLDSCGIQATAFHASRSEIIRGVLVGMMQTFVYASRFNTQVPNSEKQIETKTE